MRISARWVSGWSAMMPYAGSGEDVKPGPEESVSGPSVGEL